MSAAADEQLRATREAVVREHMESENVHDFDTTLGENLVPGRPERQLAGPIAGRPERAAAAGIRVGGAPPPRGLRADVIAAGGLCRMLVPHEDFAAVTGGCRRPRPGPG